MFSAALPLALTLSGAAASATTSDDRPSVLDDLDLAGAEQALFDDAAPLVTGASRRRQSLAEVPASVTVVTGEQIQAHGWRSLAEILSHVRGFYVADDLNYQYLGVRGFMRPGDYNSRVLLLIDDHPIIDPVFLATLITEELIDPARIERVEVIRGPGSALYGGAALLAVINVVTRTGPDARTMDGAGMELRAGVASTGAGFTSATFDRWLGTDTRVAVTAGVFGALGQRYDFPELELGHQTERAEDLAAGVRVFGRVEHGPLAVIFGLAERYKRVPTGSYGTVAGERLSTDDRLMYASGVLTLEPSPEVTWSARLGVTHYRYYGYYVYAPEDGGPIDDHARGAQLTLETSVVLRLHPALTVQVGASAQRSFDLYAWTERPGEPRAPDEHGYGNAGAYADVEWSPLDGLRLFVGGRLDAYETFGGHGSPRLAVVAEPLPGTILRAAYGTAFRAPTAFELYYDDVSAPTTGPIAALGPEGVVQIEGSVEQSLDDGRAHVGVAVFRFAMRDLIDGVATAADAFGYANVGTAAAFGGELWMDARLPWLDARVEASYSAALARDTETGQQLSASPLHLASGTADLSLGLEGLRLALALRYISARRGVDPATTVPGALAADAAVRWRDALPGLDLTVGVRNALDTPWWVPGGIEHTQARLPQEGISAWVQVSSAF